MIQPRTGEWYVVSTCEKCKCTIFLFQDLTKGRSSLKATYIITCPRCQHQGSYEGRHYQHLPQKAQAKPALIYSK